MQTKKKDDTATLTASAHNVTPRYVRMIVNGIRNADTDTAKAVLETYNKILDMKNNLSKPAEITA